MKTTVVRTFALAAFSWATLAHAYVTVPAPAINNVPVIDGPTKVLAWPIDTALKDPSLMETSANFVNDLHGKMTDCELSFTTAGNYHMALRELFQTDFLSKFTADAPLKNYFYTTSPPIAVRQIKNGVVQFHNFEATCQPSVVAAPQGVMNNLKAAGLLEGDAPLAIIKNRGSVILVKKGNPKKIKSIWDLGRENVSIVTPNALTEAGSFANYTNTIYNIALNDLANAPEGMNADKLFNAIFNAPADDSCDNHKGEKCDDKDDHKVKWYAGSTIHHREVPWSIAYGKADASVIFYHLALYMVRTFPDKFEIVPLGGTAEDPQPMVGNLQEITFITRVKSTSAAGWSDRQKEVREKLIESYKSDVFSPILASHGLLRP